jgi:hypothetical protein
VGEAGLTGWHYLQIPVRIEASALAPTGKAYQAFE